MNYATGPSPHLYSSKSVPGFFWKPIILLFILTGLYSYDQGLWVLLNAGASIFSAIGASLLARNLFKNKAALFDGHTILIALVTALMFPPTVQPLFVAIASFTAVFFGKELLGGLGNGLFHPAILGYLLIKIFLPFQTPVLSSSFPFWVWCCIYGTMAIILMVWKWARWDAVLCYFSVLLTAISFVWKFESISAALPALFLSGFYLIHQPEILPSTPGNRKLFALSCALMSGFLLTHMKSPEVFYLPILWACVLSPWLDAIFRPRFARQIGEI